MENLNLSVNAQTLEQCLKSISDFGKTTYMNICTGENYVIPWGTADWALGLVLLGIGVGIVGVLIVFACMVLFDL